MLECIRPPPTLLHSLLHFCLPPPPLAATIPIFNSPQEQPAKELCSVSLAACLCGFAHAWPTRRPERLCDSPMLAKTHRNDLFPSPFDTKLWLKMSSAVGWKKKKKMRPFPQAGLENLVGSKCKCYSGLGSWSEAFALLKEIGLWVGQMIFYLNVSLSTVQSACIF